ncbi:polysaccharide lyase 8 family protein [Streptomyces uncialis]|uniref:polysaccharide lyase 8 family protein n=1 Tax=Streptomyces uncialis TaxID=1048205 RepID=UPI00386F6269|nr:polysaccharide lyase 8 family protein [Streptomyces uncialis]
MSPTRRTFLLAGAGAPFAPALPEPAGPDDFTPLRHRWLDLTLGAGHDPGAEPYATRLRATGTRAEQLRTTMDPAPGRLWPGHPFTDPAAITRSHRRLWTMTQAYVQPGTGRTGAPGLLAATLHGLDHLATVYHPGTRPHGNWWEWRIGTPRLLTDIALALHDHLTPARHAAIRAAVDHFVPDSALRDYSGTSTGANRVDMCRVVALRGVLGRDGDRIALARDALSPVLPYVTEGDGWYADGSFLQHTRVAYTGTYGQVLLDGLARLLVLLDGTPWEITDPNRRTVLDSVERTFAPLLLDGLMMDTVNGRALSRGLQRSEDGTALRGDHSHGHTVIAAIALLATSTHPALTPERRDRWHARIKGWIARDTVTPLLDSPHLGPADLARLRAVAARPLTPAPEPVAHTLFPAMDRAVHRRPAFTAALAMASDRVAHYECGAGENPRGWHTGAGMLQWWPAGRPADQYTDWYWPTVDWYRLPGTTVSTRRLPDRAGGEWGEPRPPTRRVGGTTDGEYAAVGQDLAGLGSTLRARKSWFFLADTVLCLGAGITCADGVPVETVVDNRNLGADGTPRLRTAPGPRPHWAHLEGHGGWLLPGGAPLRTLREDRTGAWSDINAHSASDRRTRRWQTLWLDHGTDPTDASYVYAVLPGASAATLTARAATAHWLSVLANDTARQAVAVHPLGLIAANFWQPATAGGVTADAPASVLVRHHGRTATLHISEPARTGRPLGILWDRPVRRVLSHDPGIDVLTTGHRLRLRVTPGTRCASHRCEVSLA